MTKRHAIVVGVVCVLLCGAGFVAALGSADADSGVGQAEATGTASDKAAAERRALQRAVERAAGQFLTSKSKEPHFVLIRDTVLAGFAKMVKSHTVNFSRKEYDEELWTVQVRAIVDVGQFECRWAELAELLDRTGPPQVLVCVAEKIDGKAAGEPVIQKRIERQLAKEGFSVVSGAMLPAVPNMRKMLVDFAAAQGSHLLILGQAEAESSGPTEAGGQTLQSYKAGATVRLLRVDTGSKLAEVCQQPAVGIRPTAPEAAAQALRTVARRIGMEVRAQTLARWPEAMVPPTTQTAPATRPAGRASEAASCPLSTTMPR